MLYWQDTSSLYQTYYKSQRPSNFTIHTLRICLQTFLTVCTSWYTGEQTYTVIEGKTLQFAIRSFVDATLCIAALMIGPKDKLLEDFFDMKSWFMRIKKAYFFMMVLYLLLLQVFSVLILIYTPGIIATEDIIGFLVVAVILILLSVVSAFSKNDYYLSFHGTLMVVLNSIQLSTL